MSLDEITTDAQILRKGIEEELKAISLYENLASKAKTPDVKKLLLHVAQEEKVHIGEFETLLERIDPEHEPSEKEGEDEVKELLGKTSIKESVVLTSIASVIRNESF